MQDSIKTALAVLILPACLVGESGSGGSHPHSAFASALFGLNVPADGGGSDTVSDLGASWVRVELVDGSFGDDLDTAVAARFGATLDDYHARGVSVLVIADYASLGGYPGFGGGAACGDWGGWRATWLARIGRVAQQFGSRIDAWEIWNEPDQPMLACGSEDYNPGMPAAEYGTLLRDAYQAIATGAPVVTGGLDSGQVQYILDGAAAAGGLSVDGVSIHPYGVVPDASWCPNPGEDLNCDWGTLGGKVDEYGGATGLPVWITEFGVKTTDTQHQADYLTAGYGAFAGRGAAVAHAFLFCESDAMVAPFGLTFADWTAKPNAYAAYQALAKNGGGGGDTTHTTQLHGTVQTNGDAIAGLSVTAWGQIDGDFHQTTTDILGIYQFTDLRADSRYNVVVNAQFDPAAPDGYDVLDGAHADEVRNNVELVSGPDGWHGEDFGLAY